MKILQRILNWQSLRTRITVGMLVASLFTLWTAVLMLGQTLRADMEAAISAQQFSSVSLLANELDRSIRERQLILQSIASRLDGEQLPDGDTIQSLLEQRDTPESFFNWGIMVIDAHGMCTASTPESLHRRGVDFIGYPGTREALEQGKPWISEPIFSRHSQKPVIAMLQPIRNAEGRSIGAVIGIINLSAANFLDEFGTAKYGLTGDFFLTAPKSRSYIASSDHRRTMKTGPAPGINPVYDRYIDGFEGSGVALSSRGVVELSSSKRIPSSGWLMQSVLPAEEAFAPIRAMQQRLFLISTLLSIFIALFGWWWLRRQLSPLAETSRLLAGMRDGSVPRQALPIRRMDEVGELTAAFNGLQEVIVTEEARTAEHAANQRLRRIISNVPGVVFEYRRNADGRSFFPFASDGIEALYGVTPEELASSSDAIRRMLYPEDRENFFASLDKSATELSPWRIEYRINHPDGSTKWLLVNAVPEKSVDTTRWYGFIADITESKLMEAELRLAIEEQQRKDHEIQNYRDHLEHLVSTRTADLEKARAEAERLASIKSDFLANMSHEIRTPLHGVLGMAHIGLRTSDEDSKARDSFAKIINSGTLLLGIINDILDLSKMEAGMLKIESMPVEIGPIISESLDLVNERATGKGISLEYEKTGELPERFLGDPLRLRQILLNLLSNAIKFTESGVVSLKVGHESGQLLIRVDDTGIGITTSQIGNIFNPFEQGDNSTTRKFGGTGLGLAITERLVKQMGGSIEVESSPGSGSSFEIRLPCQPIRETQASTLPPSPIKPLPDQPLAGLRILVAEDNEINQEIMRENLADAGAMAVIVENGRLAVEQVQDNLRGRFDIVLMDIQMPVLNGYDATRQILAIDPQMPIIGQTAHAQTSDREACLAVGMVDYIAKPIDPDHLNRLILKHAHGAKRLDVDHLVP